MRAKLLNFRKNLIIILGLVVIVMMLFFTTSSYAVSDTTSVTTGGTTTSVTTTTTNSGTTGKTLGQMLRGTIADWYKFSSRLSISIYTICYLVLILKLLADRTPEKMKIVKESVIRFFVMLAVILFLHYIMLSIIIINNYGIEAAKNLGSSISGVDTQNDEYDLYETALSKAYEISIVPQIIGLTMYILLVLFTYIFVWIYGMRFLNIIWLIITAPIIFSISAIKRIFTGVNNGRIKRWFKEFIFNVMLQTLHAFYYSTLIGFTLKLSDNNESLIGALLTLILFGFSLKIDGIVRKIFNIVGGSTSVKNSYITSKILDGTDALVGVATGAIDKAGDGIEKLGGGQMSGKVSGFGKDINADKIKSAFSGAKENIGQGFQNIQQKFKKLPAEALDKVKEIPSGIKNFSNKAWEGAKHLPTKAIKGVKSLPKKAWKGVKVVGKGAKIAGKAVANTAKKTIKGAKKLPKKAWKGAKIAGKAVVNTAKRVYEEHGEDIIDVLNGERVKRTLTEEEIQKAYVNLKNKKVVNKIVDSVQSPKYNKILDKVKHGTKRRLLEIKNEYNYMVSDLENNYEMVKRIPQIIKKFKKQKKYIKNSNGLNMDMTNTMMLVVDTDFEPEQIIRELKEQFGTDIDVMAFVNENIGSQTFLSPVAGSPRMGMAVLAEENYSKMAEHKTIKAVTGKKHKKRTLKKASTFQSKIATKKAAKSVKRSKKVNKVYTFSRFNPDTSKKIINRLTKKSINSNRYLFVLNKTYNNMQIGNVIPVGRIKSDNEIEITRQMRATRKEYIKSVREMKLTQTAAVAKHKEAVRSSRNVQLANNVTNKVKTATNVINIGFRRIENLTPGELGLRKMIREGKAYQMPNNLVMVKKDKATEEKVKATGIFKPEEKVVVQFVVSKDGQLVQQIVDTNGKIVKPAITEDGQIVSFKHEVKRISENVLNNSQPNIQTNIQANAQPNMQNNIQTNTQVNTQPNIQNNIQTNAQVNVQPNIQNNIQANTQPNVQENVKEENIGTNVEGNVRVAKKEEQASISQTKFTPEAPKEAKIKEVVFNQNSEEKHVVTEDVSPKSAVIPEITPDIVVKEEKKLSLNEATKSISGEETFEEKIVQHIVNLEGQIIEQVINSNNEIETERYVILDNGGDNLVNEVGKTVTNEVLELPEDAPIEARVEKFENLLQDLKSQPLLEQVLQSASEETEENSAEKELDKIILEVATEKEVKSIKHFDEDEELKEEALKRIMSYVAPDEEENEDVVGNALDVLNDRIEKLSNEEDIKTIDRTMETVAEMDYVRHVEGLLNRGEFTVNNENEAPTVDEKVDEFSDLLMSLAREKVDDISNSPKKLILDTADNLISILDDLYEDEDLKTPEEQMHDELAEKEFEEDMEKIEEKWKDRKKDKGKSKETATEKAKKDKDEKTEETVKITLKFVGAIEGTSQEITLSNKYSIKDFYDKVRKRDDADLNKTQERFMKLNGGKIKELGLPNFSFATNPVAEMDGWSIYVVSNKDDVSEEQQGVNKEIQEIPKATRELIDEYFDGIRRIFINFLEEKEIYSFDELHNEREELNELVKRVRMLLFRNGEKDSQNQAKAIVNNLHNDIRFKNILKLVVKDKVAKKFAQEKMNKVKESMELKTKEKAEKDVGRIITKPQLSEEIEYEEEQIYNKTMSSVSPDVQNLLGQLQESVSPDVQELLNQVHSDFIEINNKNISKPKKMLKFES